MATITIALKTSEWRQKPYGAGENIEIVTNHGVSIEMNEDGVAALTAGECRRVARMLNALAGECDGPGNERMLPGAM